MSFKYALAICFIGCLFLALSNAQREQFDNREYHQLKRKDRNKPPVPLPTPSYHTDKCHNRTCKVNELNRQPIVQQSTPRPQFLLQWNPQQQAFELKRQPIVPLRTPKPIQANPQKQQHIPSLNGVPLTTPNPKLNTSTSNIPNKSRPKKSLL